MPEWERPRKEGTFRQDPSCFRIAILIVSERGDHQYYHVQRRERRRLEIAVEVEREDRTLVARIEDNGSPFDPTQVAPPPIPASLDEAKVGDIGIHLMRSFASGIHYERRDGTND
jgi:anti-sigma regulatory factor (Ser/Thr protein kinase)